MSFVAWYRRMAGLSTPRPPEALDCPCGAHDCAGWVLPATQAPQLTPERLEAIARRLRDPADVLSWVSKGDVEALLEVARVAVAQGARR